MHLVYFPLKAVSSIAASQLQDPRFSPLRGGFWLSGVSHGISSSDLFIKHEIPVLQGRADPAREREEKRSC